MKPEPALAKKTNAGPKSWAGVHQNVESTQLLDRLLHHRRNGFCLTDIALQPRRCEIIRRGRLVVRRDDGGAGRGEDADGGRTDTGCRAGNQDASTFKCRCHARNATAACT